MTFQTALPPLRCNFYGIASDSLEDFPIRFDYFGFSLILKGFNIGQYPAVPKFPILLFYLTSFARYPADPGRRRCSSAHLSGSVQKVAGSGELLARYPAGRRRCSSALLSSSVQRVAGPGELLAWYPAGPGELLA